MEVEQVGPSNFDQENHFYPKALNSQIHPMVAHFFSLNQDRIIKRFAHLNPGVNRERLAEVLSYQPRYYQWGGSDLFYVTTDQGSRKMVVLETNSCPSGQKSVPPISDMDEFRGYKELIEKSFIPLLKKRRLIKGDLAVIYDKNYMEVSGYANTLAELTGEKVWIIPFFNNDEAKEAFFDDGILYLKRGDKNIPIRAAFRYVTQKPWNRIPVMTKTLIFNPTIICLSGGRNKLMADKAYELYNAKLEGSGLKINVPETIKDVSRDVVPFWVEKFGGKAVVKNPYSNAGQGVYTITSQKELDAFMELEHTYDQFIVQSLIGHYNWSSVTNDKLYYHIGTVPNKRGNSFVADIRMMVHASEAGFRTCALYARKAKKPLKGEITPEDQSWEMLGTNLSEKLAENKWDTDTNRLILMDRKDFNLLGIGIDDLIEAYIQTVLCVCAIDEMAKRLVNQKGQFRFKLFKSLDKDKALLDEILLK